jgi:hypothetical protein
MKQEIPYKAAASAAVAIAAGREPEKILIQNVAQHLRLGNSTQRKAFESFLRGFEQPRLMRLVEGLRNEAEEVPILAAPLGEVRFLFKPPLPGETQARLAYECFLLSPTAKNGMKLVDQTSPFSFKMDSPNRLQSPYPHQE